MNNIYNLDIHYKYNFIIWLIKAKLKLEKINIYHNFILNGFYLNNNHFVYKRSSEIYFQDSNKQYFILENQTNNKYQDFINTYNIILNLFKINNKKEIFNISLDTGKKKILYNILKYISSDDKSITYNEIDFIIYIYS